MNNNNVNTISNGLKRQPITQVSYVDETGETKDDKKPGRKRKMHSSKYLF